MENSRLDEFSANKPFVNIDEVVANATTLLPTSTDHDRNIFRQWAWLAERQLGFGAFSEEVSEVKVEDLSFKKPSNMAEPIDVVLLSEDGTTAYQYSYKRGKSRIHPQFDSSRRIDLSEDAWFFHLGSSADGYVKKAKIRYYAYPMDDEKRPMFPNHHLFAIMMFIRWMYAMRIDANQAGIQLKERDWLKAKVAAKSKNKVPTMLEGKQIQRTWNSMINKVFNDEF